MHCEHAHDSVQLVLKLSYLFYSDKIKLILLDLYQVYLLPEFLHKINLIILTDSSEKYSMNNVKASKVVSVFIYARFSALVIKK